jgi:1,4-dihydroxy-2-naphthoyl-CoA hydrolase
MENTEKTRKINEFNAKTMVGHIGIEIMEVGKDFVSGRMPVDERTTQPYGLLHGGASVAFAESLGSLAGSFHVDWKKEAVVGIEINANHLKSIRSGWVYGKATPVRIGKRFQVWDINITNEDKEAVCVSRLTLAIVKSENYNNSFTKE